MSIRLGLKRKKKENKLYVKTEYNASHYELLGYELMGEFKAGGLQVYRGERAFLSHHAIP